MALRREWKPVSHYSTGRGAVRLIVLHTTEGAQTKESLYNWFSNPAAKVSSHVGIDNRSRVIHEYVRRNHAAWAQGNYNGVAICAEQCTPAGAANGWSRDYWLTQQATMLSVTAEWIAEEAKAFGIPITKLTAAQAQGTGRGVCGHVDIQPQDRTDPGRNYPWDRVLEMARGGAAPTPSPPGGLLEMSACGVIVNSKLHQVAVWNDGRPHYQFESTGWKQLDPDPAFKAKSGASITANYVTGLLVIMVTGMDSNVYSFQQRLADPEGAAATGKWARYNRGGFNAVR